jgi:hypothetical protein
LNHAVFNTCSNDDESRRLKHCRLSFFAIFATFCSHVFSGSIAIPGTPYRIQRRTLAAGLLSSADCGTAIKSTGLAIMQYAKIATSRALPPCCELDVALVIFVTEKRLLPADSALRHVMR